VTRVIRSLASVLPTPVKMVEVVETPIRVTLAHVSTLGMDPTVNLTLIRVQTNVQMVLVQIPAI